MDNTESQTLTIHLVIRSREKVAFEGEVFAFTSVNERGIFDVLPEHENFISVIRDLIVIHKKTPNGEANKEELKIDRGIVRVIKNKVDAFLLPNVATPTPPATPQAQPVKKA